MADTVKVTLDAPPGVPKVTVEGEPFGQWWALTPCWGSTFQLDPRYMAVTHVPSGKAVGSYAFHNVELVRELGRKLAASCNGEEWGHADDSEIPDAAKAVARDIYEAWLQEHMDQLVGYGVLLGED